MTSSKRCDQRKTFFSDGIKKLVDRCKKYVDEQGNYGEKLCHNYVSITYIFVIKSKLPLFLISSLTFGNH
jgi:hypothetical protein